MEVSKGLEHRGKPQRNRRGEPAKAGRETSLQDTRSESRRDAGEINEGHRVDQTAGR